MVLFLLEDYIMKKVIEFFCYFNPDEINPEDLEHVYDIKCINGKEVVSLKRPYAMKYGKALCNEKKICMVEY